MSTISDIKKEIFGDLQNKNIENNKLTSKDVFKEESEIYISMLQSFEENPFKLCGKEEIKELAESIKDEGLLNPIILWKKENSYVILSGHNRIEALKMIGYEKLDKTMYKIKENISLEDARLILVDTNLVQRKDILPSERAKAYKIWKQVLEQKQAKRSENFVFENAVNTGEIAEQKDLYHDVTNENRMTIFRYLRLNYLITDLLNKVDEKELSLVMAVELSYLKENVQNIVFDYFFIQNKSSLSMDICKKIREKATKVEITEETLALIIESVEKKKIPRTFKLNFKDIREISNKTFTTDKEAKDYVLECVRFYEENNKEC
ncbi:ParB N-terminal domain-containing protein [uncultured Tyzzerella sp.]|uniref:ParB/RepB/Spo0J family partition protein n=1 Tax=uncultured Tyzzerella sp. TaxID=2321398 RepID=UPI002941C267|nr:ParB N-terminal domain-containing protein [uncultured Tyzzerella sp.]